MILIDSKVSILILLDYLFLFHRFHSLHSHLNRGFNPYFIGLPILIFIFSELNIIYPPSFNPYFIGLPILIVFNYYSDDTGKLFQSLFYWITYSYFVRYYRSNQHARRFQSLFYWITYSYIVLLMLIVTLTGLFQSLFYWITYSYSIK